MIKNFPFIILISLASTLLCIVSCNSNVQQLQKIQFPTMRDITAKQWDNLAKTTIYFGHQSVGLNIISGMEEVLSENPYTKLNINKGNSKAIYTFESATFFHKAIGKNQDPISKIDDFKDTFENKFTNKPHIAFFKFCFVDFDPRTNINKVFAHYKKTMGYLKHKYPDTIFIHVTAPLTCYAAGPEGWVKRAKDIVKKIIGKLNVYDFSSANMYNQKLRDEFTGKEPLFDLALIESTYPNGTRAFFRKNNQTYFTLVQDYTSDGGHLNQQGRKKVAEQLLIFLAKLANQN